MHKLVMVLVALGALTGCAAANQKPTQAPKSASPVVAPAADTSAGAGAPAQASGVGPRTLREKLQTDIAAAITDAQAAVSRAPAACASLLSGYPNVMDLPSHCAPAFYASKRIVCWRDIEALANSLPVIDPGEARKPAGVFDAFELGAQKVEDVVDITDSTLPAGMKAVLDVDCGWIGQRAILILNTLGARVVRLGANIGLIPK